MVSLYCHISTLPDLGREVDVSFQPMRIRQASVPLSWSVLELPGAMRGKGKLRRTYHHMVIARTGQHEWRHGGEEGEDPLRVPELQPSWACLFPPRTQCKAS